MDIVVYGLLSATFFGWLASHNLAAFPLRRWTVLVASREIKGAKTPESWFHKRKKYCNARIWQRYAHNNTCEDIVESQFWSLLSHQGGCWTALLRRNTLPQNRLCCRGPRPCRHPLCHPSQVVQLLPKEIHSDQIHFSIFKKRKRTSFYPRLAIAYSLIVLIIIIRFGHIIRPIFLQM